MGLPLQNLNSFRSDYLHFVIYGKERKSYIILAMGLYISKNINLNSNFSLKGSSTLLIVGLGNVGKEYSQTRHNIGFDCVNQLQTSQSEFSPWSTKKNLFCNFSSGIFNDTKVILIKPTTFMNNSGQSVASVLEYFKTSLKSMVVVHDDLDIDFGQIRCKIGGSSAGHNGIKSISAQIGDAYGRVRVGINNNQPPQQDTANFVLDKFTKSEQASLPLLIREAQSILIEFIYRGNLAPETRNFIIE